jgi:hypothetical protein
MAAVNGAEILREAIIHQIRNLGALYCVGRRRPISELTPEQQEKVREAYKDTLWSSDYGVDLMGICTTQSMAEEICKEHGPKNWFWTKLPVDSVLGDDPVFGEWAHVFPGSDAVEMYENMESATVAVRASYLRVLEDERLRLEEQIKLAREALTGRLERQ